MATKRVKSKSKTNTTKKVSEDDIRKKANQIYLNRIEKGIHADADSDWIQAEKELTVKKKKRVTSKKVLA
ncbi:hypothetical protein [Ancylomarina sp. 16SWW S1-10-2]|uniref:hypothetical protein n=1 Tax=Ancylomarina sp. 16SWW S1-10-2 TaxID=2499681 RepID=UPI0012AE700B|nr:hypothetical protein [Ancylomarina sp. 16SWW S1-10-2]MRT93922.1 hypothetical protein [Ancylomarina sp. 16SWW S1-10-2]